MLHKIANLFFTSFIPSNKERFTMRILNINSGKHTNLTNFEAKAPIKIYKDIKNIPNITCACCGKPTYNQAKIIDAFSAISRPLSEMLKKGFFNTQKDILLIWNHLQELTIKYPKTSLDNILKNKDENNALRKIIEIDLKENSKLDIENMSKYEFSDRISNRVKGLLNYSRNRLRSSSVVMKRLASFKKYLDGEKLATFEQLEIYSKKYPKKTISEILRMDEIYNFHRIKDLLQRAETREKLDFHYSNILDMVKRENPDAEGAFILLKERALELIGIIDVCEQKYFIKNMYTEELEKYNCQKIKDKVYAELEQIPTTFITKDSFLTYAVNHKFDDGAIISSLLTPYAASFEHIVPKHNQGSNDIANGIIMCRRCNQMREREPYNEFVKYHPMMPYNTQKQILQITEYILDGKLGTTYDFWPIEVAKTLEEYSQGAIKLDISEYCKRRSKKIKVKIEESGNQIHDMNQEIANQKSKRDKLLKEIAEVDQATKNLRKQKDVIVKEHVHNKALNSRIEEYLDKNEN